LGCYSGHWIFQLTQSLQPHYGPGVDSASNRNEYQESFWGLKGGHWFKLKVKWGCSVSIVAGIRVGRLVNRSLITARDREFSFLHGLDIGSWGPSSLLSNGYVGPFSGKKLRDSEIYHSPHLLQKLTHCVIKNDHEEYYICIVAP
jgi:hypothetical protein